MSSLAQLPKLVGFFSYSRNDDEGDVGAVAALAHRIYFELRTQLGRNNENFKLWRDKDALATGEQWKEKLNEAVSESVFFIQMVTPSAVNSNFCRFEFESFIERERDLGRNDLVFPILYVSVPDLDSTPASNDPVISIVKERQYEDWRPIRHHDINSREVKQTVEQFCSVIAKKLRATWLSPEERRQLELQRQAEEQRRLQEAESKRRAEEEERQAIEAEKRQQQERQLQEIEAKRRADEEEWQRVAEAKSQAAERVEQRLREKKEKERREQDARQLRASRTDDHRVFIKSWLSSEAALRTLGILLVSTAAYVYLVFSTIAEAVHDRFITWFPPLIVTNVVVNCLFGFGVLVIGQRIPLSLCSLGALWHAVVLAYGINLLASTSTSPDFDQSVGNFVIWSSLPYLLLYISTFVAVKYRRKVA